MGKVIMPVLLYDGLRFLENTNMEQIQLERLQVVELPAGRTQLKFRILK